MVSTLTVDIVPIENIPSAELGPGRAGIDGRDQAEVILSTSIFSVQFQHKDLFPSAQTKGPVPCREIRTSGLCMKRIVLAAFLVQLPLQLGVLPPRRLQIKNQVLDADPQIVQGFLQGRYALP